MTGRLSKNERWGIKSHDIDSSIAMLAGKAEAGAIAVHNTGARVMNEIIIKSPVGDRRTTRHTPGTFRKLWYATKPSKYTVKLINMIVYALPVIEGSKPGQAPWPSPGPRTMMHNGRVMSRAMVNNPPAQGAFMDTVFSKDRVHKIFTQEYKKAVKGAGKKNLAPAWKKLKNVNR